MQIRGVLDSGQEAHGWAASKTMIHPNTKLFLPKKSGPLKDLGKLHHKLMVIDEQVVVAGSFNYTEPANDYNDENLFVLGSVFPKVEKIVVDKASLPRPRTAYEGGDRAHHRRQCRLLAVDATPQAAAFAPEAPALERRAVRQRRRTRRTSTSLSRTPASGMRNHARWFAGALSRCAAC
jgi:PLD-like domain